MVFPCALMRFVPVRGREIYLRIGDVLEREAARASEGRGLQLASAGKLLCMREVENVMRGWERDCAVWYMYSTVCSVVSIDNAVPDIESWLGKVTK